MLLRAAIVQSGQDSEGFPVLGSRLPSLLAARPAGEKVEIRNANIHGAYEVANWGLRG
jgi:hypothetical protein